ncbi:MAG: twin transmembrane helix small protein [Rhizobiaceae bacterium]|nr:twin transmembrane helix small protein [Rhizobiaceae bacterium]
MSVFLFYLAPVIMAGVVIILGLGLWNMARGGNNEFAQKMMRYRILAQFVAVVVMLTALYFVGR